jgi:hypothetical protein
MKSSEGAMEQVTGAMLEEAIGSEWCLVYARELLAGRSISKKKRLEQEKDARTWKMFFRKGYTHSDFLKACNPSELKAVLDYLEITWREKVSRAIAEELIAQHSDPDFPLCLALNPRALRSLLRKI